MALLRHLIFVLLFQIAERVLRMTVLFSNIAARLKTFQRDATMTFNKLPCQHQDQEHLQELI